MRNLKLMKQLACAIVLLLAGPAGAADRVVIRFADLGNIRDWHADSTEELYVQSMNRDWHRITFWAPCHNLPFAVGIGFVADSMGNLDRYSSILVGGERCWFRTFESSGPPPSHDDNEAPKTTE